MSSRALIHVIAKLTYASSAWWGFTSARAQRSTETRRIHIHRNHLGSGGAGRVPSPSSPDLWQWDLCKSGSFIGNVRGIKESPYFSIFSFSFYVPCIILKMTCSLLYKLSMTCSKDFRLFWALSRPSALVLILVLRLISFIFVRQTKLTAASFWAQVKYHSFIQISRIVSYGVYSDCADADACHDADGRINFSGRLVVDDCGCLLVLDVDNRRVLQFDVGADLRLVRELVSRDARLRYPTRLCVDRSRGRLYVADNELSQRSRLQTKYWGKTGRVVVYDTYPA